MNQLTLFAPPHSHTGDPLSSFVAGDKAVKSGKAKWYRKRIIELVEEHGPLNNKQLAEFIEKERPQYKDIYHDVARRAPETGLIEIIYKDGRMKEWNVKQALTDCHGPRMGH